MVHLEAGEKNAHLVLEMDLEGWKIGLNKISSQSYSSLLDDTGMDSKRHIGNE